LDTMSSSKTLKYWICESPHLCIDQLHPKSCGIEFM
jgi:hypothetical protein